eukprot:CAMPEP_0174978380 /NCGR_PEP_ID=MMETSP0004_2-20121128/14171_1 /TAXON_ID=420556 /ORGANISM="Ochromonas sp., Strain CCMP1393" /LENGTH=125 /DNA_ID=CAMNT_0016229745 /DNA_START=412 /DNA_END=789 /DNA_ORIENTATION=+
MKNFSAAEVLIFGGSVFSDKKARNCAPSVCLNSEKSDSFHQTKSSIHASRYSALHGIKATSTILLKLTLRGRVGDPFSEQSDASVSEFAQREFNEPEELNDLPLTRPAFIAERLCCFLVKLIITK